MNIVLVPNSYPPQIGGLEVSVHSIARELVNAGNSVTVIAGTPANVREDEETGGIAVCRVPFSLPRLVTAGGKQHFVRSLWTTALFPATFPGNVFRFLATIRKVKPAVVNLHYLAENAFYCLLGKFFFPFKFVVSLHGSDIERYATRSFPARWLARKTLQSADHVVANSQDLLAKAIRIEPSVAEKSTVIGNGVYPDEFFPGHAVEGKEKSSILCIANFSYGKGQDILIRAFAQAYPTLPHDTTLLFAGDGPELSKCRELSKHLGVGTRVQFLGKVDREQISRLLAESAVCVIPSRKEAFGIVALEAMASRKPVIASRVGGLQKIIRHMDTGILFTSESPDALAEALKLVLNDQNVANRFADNGYRHVINNYSWAEIRLRYEEIYKRISAAGRKSCKETNQ